MSNSRYETLLLIWRCGKLMATILLHVFTEDASMGLPIFNKFLTLLWPQLYLVAEKVYQYHRTWRFISWIILWVSFLFFIREFIHKRTSKSLSSIIDSYCIAILSFLAHSSFVFSLIKIRVRSDKIKAIRINSQVYSGKHYDDYHLSWHYQEGIHHR